MKKLPLTKNIPSPNENKAEDFQGKNNKKPATRHEHVDTSAYKGCIRNKELTNKLHEKIRYFKENRKQKVTKNKVVPINVQLLWKRRIYIWCLCQKAIKELIPPKWGKAKH